MRVFSTDHKVIGLQYAVTSLLFLLLAFTFVLIGAANSGWTSYPPLAMMATSVQTAGLVGC